MNGSRSPYHSKPSIRPEPKPNEFKKIDLERVLADLAPGFAERAPQADETATFVDQNYDELSEARLFSAMVPTELGGGGASHSEVCDFVRRVAHSCGSTALSVSMHQHLAAAALYKHQRGLPGRAVL